MKYITLECPSCHKSFERRLCEYLLHKKRKRKNLYCSRSCKSSHCLLDNFSNFKSMLWKARDNAIKRKKEFDLDLEYLKKLWDEQNGLCSYTKIPMILSKKKKCGINSASLDRIDSSKRYIKGNVEIVCLFINLGKNNFDKLEVKEFLSKIKI